MNPVLTIIQQNIKMIQIEYPSVTVHRDDVLPGITQFILNSSTMIFFIKYDGSKRVLVSTIAMEYETGGNIEINDLITEPIGKLKDMYTQQHNSLARLG